MVFKWKVGSGNRFSRWLLASVAFWAFFGGAWSSVGLASPRTATLRFLDESPAVRAIDEIGTIDLSGGISNVLYFDASRFFDSLIFFDQGDATPDASSLGAVSRKLNSSRPDAILLVGFASVEGSDAHNLKLSEQRISEVFRQLKHLVEIMPEQSLGLALGESAERAPAPSMPGRFVSIVLLYNSVEDLQEAMKTVTGHPAPQVDISGSPAPQELRPQRVDSSPMSPSQDVGSEEPKKYYRSAGSSAQANLIEQSAGELTDGGAVLNADYKDLIKQFQQLIGEVQKDKRSKCVSSKVLRSGTWLMLDDMSIIEMCMQ